MAGFFFLLGEYEPEYATQKKIEIGNFNDNKILSLIIANAVTKGTMSTRLTEEVYRIEKNSIEDYMDLKIAYEKAYELTKKKEFLDIPKRLALHMVAFLCTMETDCVDYVLGDRVTGSRVEQTYNKIVSTLQNDINNKFLLPLS